MLALAAGCGDDDGTPAGPDASDPPPAGPYDDVPLGVDLNLPGVEAPVHVVRDEFGILHIHAENTRDLAFVQGYMMAHDRLPQMDILRRFGAGELAELFGALDASVIETDLEMRVHRMRPLAQQAFDDLEASSDPTDAEIVAFLERFADGINAYNTDLVAGKYELDELVLVSYDPSRFRAWSPVDSLILGRFQQFALSYTAPLEVDITDIYQAAVEHFDESPSIEEPGYDRARFFRKGASADLLRMTPIGDIPTIDGFPNVATDTGTRADGSGTAAAAKVRRPKVPRPLLSAARHFFRPKMKMGPHAFMVPRSGSNNWVVAPEHAGGKALLAGDQHLSMPNPSIFYPVHLVVPGELDVEGVTFPGIPGIILGHNGKVAWTATTAFHDVNDLYLETIVPCTEGGGDCVVFDGGQVPIEQVQEEVKVGALGTITRTIDATYEWVPHHGPIIPTVADGELVPRAGSQALSVRYTGHSPSYELRTLWELARAEDVEGAFRALRHWQYGAQNWAIIDNAGNIGWTTNADVPLRAPGVYSWDPDSNRHGAAPMFVLPGDGSAEWEGFMDARYLPHAINPDQGYLVTANSDLTGATFDGNPLDEPVVDGRPLYVGAMYAPGLRTARIANLLQGHIDAGDTLDLTHMAAIQHDSQSTVGERLRDALVALLETADDDPGPSGVEVWQNTVGPDRVARVIAAAGTLDAWTLATPPAVIGAPTAQEVTDSSATTLFNVWMHFFLERALGDEYAAIGWDVHDVNENASVRTVYALLVDPESLATLVLQDTGSPVLCDDMTTYSVDESCAAVAAAAMDDALEWLRSAEGFGTDDLASYTWGSLHTLTMEPLFPETNLNVPPPNDPDPALRGGYPSAGDTFVVNRADAGWKDLDFSHTADGPAQRFLAEVEAGGTVRARMSLPGGTIYNRSSEHYRDLLDDYYMKGQQFDLPYSTAEVVAAGKERWVFRATAQ